MRGQTEMFQERQGWDTEWLSVTLVWVALAIRAAAEPTQTVADHKEYCSISKLAKL